MLNSYGWKIPESPWGSPIPVRDGDEDVKRFSDGDEGGDGDEVEKRGWGCTSPDGADLGGSLRVYENPKDVYRLV
ncbi:hypothetical protein Tco_0243466 [Tanacetum coccineum]